MKSIFNVRGFQSFIAVVSLFFLMDSALSQPVVPYYTSESLVNHIYHHYHLQTNRWQTAQHLLTQELQSYCRASSDIESIQKKWQETLLQWLAISTVAIEPMLEERWVRTIDFTPTRPRLINQFITKVNHLEDLQNVGTPAKGYPALEWILWQKPEYLCSYGLLLSQELDILSTRSIGVWSKNNTDHTLVIQTWLNQWLAGLQKLYWVELQKPLKVAGEKHPPIFLRPYSQFSVTSWESQWATLYAFAINQPSDDYPISIEYILRSRGEILLADEWHTAVQNTHNHLQTAFVQQRENSHNNQSSLERAIPHLNKLIQFFEQRVAPALNIPMEFSGSDGD